MPLGPAVETPCNDLNRAFFVTRRSSPLFPAMPFCGVGDLLPPLAGHCPCHGWHEVGGSSCTGTQRGAEPGAAEFSGTSAPTPGQRSVGEPFALTSGEISYPFNPLNASHAEVSFRF